MGTYILQPRVPLTASIFTAIASAPKTYTIGNAIARLTEPNQQNRGSNLLRAIIFNKEPVMVCP